LLFIEKTQEYFTTSYSLILTAIEWLRKTELTPYNYPAWILLLISIFLLISIITIFIILKKNTKLEYTSYTQDSIYGTIWKWKWIKNEISNLQCHCPTCDSILVYDDTSCHSKYTDLTKTDFICESCKSKLITSIHGGNKTYAFSAIKREIERRIRTEEYKINMHLSK
jgi:Zn finger protein HypA/HybF involved in hydrogenase expression